jgi:putative ABC transport system permease protein
VAKRAPRSERSDGGAGALTRQLSPSILDPPRVRAADGLADVLLGLVRRPGRSALTMIGTVVGILALVATTALSTTVSHQVSSAFDEVAATEVIVRDNKPDSIDSPFADDYAGRLAQVPGVRSAGLLWDVSDTSVSALPLSDADDAQHLPLVAADPGAVLALRPTISSGRIYDSALADLGADVALLGSGAAQRLNFGTADGSASVFVNGHSLTVLGVVTETGRRPETLLSVIVPRRTASDRLGLTGVPELLIDTRPGAARVVALQAPVALSPNDPGRLNAIAPPDPRALRQTVEGRLRALFYGVAAISLVVGAMGIANSTLVSVLERTGEFGLRRALGATPRHIVVGVVGEAAALGGLGGLIGASAGLLLVVTIAFAQNWQVVADPWLLSLGPLLGSSIGALAGLAPALRARRTQPVDALRH